MYTTGYDTVKEDMPWDFWTDEERSWVVNQAYERFMLKSSEVQRYLTLARLHQVVGWVFPVGAWYASSFLTKSWRVSQRSRLRSKLFYAATIGLTTVLSLLWWNWNPLYAAKEKEQEKIMKIIYKERIGENIILLNDILPRWSTTSSFDKKTRRLYAHRNGGWFAGLLYPGNDDMRPISEPTKAEKHTVKKIYR